MPVGYSNTLRFIVTGVDHKLNQGDWETTLNTTLIPKTDTISKITGSLTFSVQKEAAVAPVKPVDETETPSKNGERGDLFTWSQGFDWPDPHVPGNYAGQKVKKGGKEYILNETMRQKFLNFEKGGTYVALIFKSSKISSINEKSTLIQKPGGRLT
jgi:hypothetical protein